MTAPLFNRSALRAGMILGRRGTAPVSYAIMLRTAGLRATLDGTAWSHDGTLIAHNARWYVGDAEMGKKARLVPLEDWEAAMRRGECKAIVLWPRGVFGRARAGRGVVVADARLRHGIRQASDQTSCVAMGGRSVRQQIGGKRINSIAQNRAIAPIPLSSRRPVRRGGPRTSTRRLARHASARCKAAST